MNTRGRLMLGGLSVVAGVVGFALSFTLPDVGEPAYPHSYNEYANGYAISHLPMAAIALILVGVVIGMLPAGRSPYRLILSGIAVATAPLCGSRWPPHRRASPAPCARSYPMGMCRRRR